MNKLYSFTDRKQSYTEGENKIQKYNYAMYTHVQTQKCLWFHCIFKKKKIEEFGVLRVNTHTFALTFGKDNFFFFKDFVIQKDRGIIYPKIMFMTCLGCNRVPPTHKGTGLKRKSEA